MRIGSLYVLVCFCLLCVCVFVCVLVFWCSWLGLVVHAILYGCPRIFAWHVLPQAGRYESWRPRPKGPRTSEAGSGAHKMRRSVSKYHAASLECNTTAPCISGCWVRAIVAVTGATTNLLLADAEHGRAFPMRVAVPPSKAGVQSLYSVKSQPRRGQPMAPAWPVNPWPRRGQTVAPAWGCYLLETN